MKYIKLFSLLAAVIFLGSCKDDDENWNSTSDVTVSMGKTEYSPKEGAGIVYLPINVEGNTNGLVSVTVETREVGNNPAKEDVNYYVTTKTLKISDGQGNLEVEFVDDDEINKPRTFEVTIVSAKGAKIGENKTTSITIRDNDTEYYDKLQGNWEMNGVDDAGKAIKWNVSITGAADENNAEYNKTLYIEGMCGLDTKARLDYYFDEVSKTCSVAIVPGQYAFAKGLNFGMTNPMDIWLVRLEGKNLSFNPVDGEVSSDMKTITFDQDAILTGYLVDSVTGETPGYIWFGNGIGQITKITMTKSK
uniref:Calx-beta domain-containing protein n=1 Tax=Prevotella sp. TaxID=59823 RepID=UPI00402A4C01